AGVPGRQPGSIGGNFQKGYSAARIGDQSLCRIPARAELDNKIPRFAPDFIRGHDCSSRIDKETRTGQPAMFILGLDSDDSVFGLIENPFNFSGNGIETLLSTEP